MLSGAVLGDTIARQKHSLSQSSPQLPGDVACKRQIQGGVGRGSPGCCGSTDQGASPMPARAEEQLPIKVKSLQEDRNGLNGQKLPYAKPLRPPDMSHPWPFDRTWKFRGLRGSGTLGFGAPNYFHSMVISSESCLPFPRPKGPKTAMGMPLLSLWWWHWWWQWWWCWCWFWQLSITEQLHAHFVNVISLIFTAVL